MINAKISILVLGGLLFIGCAAKNSNRSDASLMADSTSKLGPKPSLGKKYRYVGGISILEILNDKELQITRPGSSPVKFDYSWIDRSKEGMDGLWAQYWVLWYGSFGANHFVSKDGKKISASVDTRQPRFDDEYVLIEESKHSDKM